MQQAAYDTTNAHQLQGNSNRSVGLQEASFPEYFPAGTFSGLDKPVQPQDSRVIQFPTVGKYTQDEDVAVAQVAHDLGFTPPPVKQGNVFRDPPFYSAYDAEYVAPAPMAEMAPSSHQRVEDKNQAVPFLFKDQPVRVHVGVDGEAWFIAKDVCVVLELAGSPAQHVRRLDEDERGVIINHTLGGPQEMLAISESGLYQLVFTSRKPEAKEFTRWVKHEVLPAVRKHGAYMTSDTLEQAILSPDFVIGLATKLKEERAKAAELEAANAKINAEKIRLAFEKGALAIAKDRLAHENSILKPKADMHDSLMEADGAIEMGDAAKVLSEDFPGIGRNKLFRFLRWYGVLVYTRQYTIPSQRYMNSGYFRVVMRRGNHYGSRAKSRFVYPQTFVKPEGMRYLHKLISKFYDGNTLRYTDDKAA